jgi:3-deoxy-D-manno-octulosonic-acid transferase
MGIIYNLGILLYRALARFLSPFSEKASLWSGGQDECLKKLSGTIKKGEKYIWVHCASLGEFEQGRPVIEAVRKARADYRIIITFFSPSGYEVRKNWPLADVICYLPADTPSNARRFVSVVSPEMALFVKYEFWNNYLKELHRNKIPVYLISGIFRKSQHFFHWYGGFFRAMLRRFSWIFVQDEASRDLLLSAGIENVSVAGDTRFDRVLEIASEAKVIPEVEAFRGDEKLLVAGSSWKPDEEIMARYINSYPEKMKWIFAPHETDPDNLRRLEKLFKVKSVRFSRFGKDDTDVRVMIIDNVGMLSSVYRYAYVAAVGGGFGKGIHNVLEPACWSRPVLFGPEHGKFREAVDLIAEGGAGTFSDYNEFRDLLDRWLTDEDLYIMVAGSAGRYVKKNSGATAMIITKII